MNDDFARALDLAGRLAVLRYYLGAACDYAEGGHVPPDEVVARWRELAATDCDGDAPAVPSSEVQP